MNKKYTLVLISIIFISLAIGLYVIGYKEGLEPDTTSKNKGASVTVGSYLRDNTGNLVYANNGQITIKKLDSQGIVSKTDPVIQLDNNGWPLLNSDGKVIYNPQVYILDDNGQIQKDSSGKPIYTKNKGASVNAGTYLRDNTGNLVYANNGLITIKKLDSRGIVSKTDPDIQIDNDGWPLLNSDDKVKYNPQVYMLDDNGQIQKDSSGKPIYNPNYKFSSNYEDPETKYDKDNYGVTYHKSEQDILSEDGGLDIKKNDMYVLSPEFIKKRQADLIAYQNALAELKAKQTSPNPSTIEISAANDAVNTAAATLSSDNDISDQFNKDLLAYRSAISEGDNNALETAIAILSNNVNYIKISKLDIQGDINYYDPSTFRFGSATYVPSYEDSVYLSRTTGESTVRTIQNPAYMLGGVCTYYKNQPQKIEEACQKLDKNTCASTSCCVLLGGTKCVSGNEQGPKVKSNFSDIYVRNRDFYYFQGKCYGNCP